MPGGQFDSAPWWKFRLVSNAGRRRGGVLVQPAFDVTSAALDEVPSQVGPLRLAHVVEWQVLQVGPQEPEERPEPVVYAGVWGGR